MFFYRHILINICLICLANARVLRRVGHLPGSQLQMEKLACYVCNDLDFMFNGNKTLVDACPQNFLSVDKSLVDASVVEMRCRLGRTLQFQVIPNDRWQAVVLMPDTEEEIDINYVLIEPKEKFSEISVFASSTNYTAYSSVLNQDGRPSIWHRQERVLARNESVPDHRDYAVRVEFINHTHSMVTGVVTWNHTGDSDVCFKFSNSCNKGRKQYMDVWRDMGQRVVLPKLPLNENCRLQVTGMHGTTELKYRTPSRDADSLKDPSSKDTSNAKLEVPRNISIEAGEDGDSWKLKIAWAKPTVQPERYEVVVRAGNIHTQYLLGNATAAFVTGVTGEGLYNVSVFAYKGKYKAHAFKRAILIASTPSSAWRWVGAAGGAWVAAGLCLFAVALCWLRFRTRIFTETKPKGQECKPLDDGLDAHEECEDQWEVKCSRLALHEVIGSGAFGVVRRGVLAPAAREVAVKMLKDFPTHDETRAFRLEMELMKSVGAHGHVVSLVGCCSGRRPLIIAEYCAHGDLLSFLRWSWDVMLTKRSAKYYNTNIETDYRNNLFKCKPQREHSRLVVNKMYDLQGQSDADLTSLDLLSFCRQIAMGMEFLSANRLVHRDLAARNVLVTSDRTLKIADFGLSRDVYEENQYRQKGNGKMPVKWMAPESLTRRIYSSQSDVWSFGVVVWEVVTVGATPYPDVPAARLPRLLRAGYRMPRPHNCSKQLYSVMLSCWASHPRARPSFAALHARLDELLNGACAHDYLSLELDDAPPPAHPAARYFKMIMRGKRAWSRETYERPLKAIQGNHNHYTSPPATLSKAPA